MISNAAQRGPLFNKVPQNTREDLVLECGGLCPVPRCGKEFWDFYTIDGDQRSLGKENLIALCYTHFSMAKAKALSAAMLRTIRSLLTGDRFPETGPSVRPLRNRADYLREAARQLYTTDDEFYVTYVGPLCLHPDWYHERRDDITKLPNMDRPIREYLRAQSADRQAKIRIIFRNTPRYIDKVNEIVKPTERDKFINDVLAEIANIWGDDGERGPDMCCVDTGFLHIPVLYKRVAITASRTGARTPIQEGALYLDRQIVDLEKERFNKLFDANTRSIGIELKELKTFISGLWSDTNNRNATNSQENDDKQDNIQNGDS